MMSVNISKSLSAVRHWQNIKRYLMTGREPARKSFLDQPKTGVNLDQERLIKSLQKDGVAVVTDYWDEDRCASARAEIDRLLSEFPNAVRRFSGGADRRMFGVEGQSSLLRDFHLDDTLRSVGERLGDGSLYNLATLGARIDATQSNVGSGEGWHRDAFGFQFKAIIYLSDVSVENGPFEYLTGSHKLWRVALDAVLDRVEAPPESRMDNDRLNKLITAGRLKKRNFPASAGTVILANTTGVHRGAPLVNGCRYALTNYYYYNFQISESLIDKFAPLLPGVEDRLRNEIHEAARRRKQAS